MAQRIALSWLLVLFLGWLIGHTHCIVIHRSERYYYNGGKTSQINSGWVEGASLAVITSQDNFSAFNQRLISPQIIQIIPNTFRYIQLPNPSYSSYQIRTAPNPIFNISSNYLLFCLSHISHTNTFFSPIKIVLNISSFNSSYLIKQAIFTSSNQTMFAVGKFNSTMYNYYAVFYVNYDGVESWYQWRDVEIGDYTRLVDLRYYAGKVYVLWTDRILVYGDSKALTLMNTIMIADGNTQSPSMAIGNDTLVYCIQRICKVLDITSNYSQTQQIPVQNLVTDVSLLHPYIIITSQTQILQYDLQTKIFTDNFTNSHHDNKMTPLTDNFFMSYRKYPATYYQTQIYQIDYNYYCNQSTLCTGCVQGYSFNSTGLVCVRDGKIEDRIQLEVGVKYLAMAISLTSTRLTPAFVWLTVFYLDDLSYYNYHHEDYPEFISGIFNSASLINVIRLNPFIIEFMQLINQDTQEKPKNYKYWQHFLPYSKKNPTSIYIPNSTQPLYKANLLLNTLVFILSRTLLLFLEVLHKNCRILKQIYTSFRPSVVWWSFFVMVLESNVMSFTFCWFVQMRVFFCFDQWDKGWLAACVFVGFGVLSYCFGVYPMCFRYCYKKHADLFLIRTKYQMSSYFVQPICSVGRNFFRAAAHALFLSSYPSQMLALTIFDLLFLLPLLLFKKSFINSLTFYATFCTNTAYLILDFVLCLRSRGAITLEEGRLENFMKSVMISIIACVCVLSAVVMGYRLRDFGEILLNNFAVSKIQTEVKDNKNKQLIPVEKVERIQEKKNNTKSDKNQKKKKKKCWSKIIKKQSIQVKNQTHSNYHKKNRQIIVNCYHQTRIQHSQTKKIKRISLIFITIISSTSTNIQLLIQIFLNDFLDQPFEPRYISRSIHVLNRKMLVQQPRILKLLQFVRDPQPLHLLLLDEANHRIHAVMVPYLLYILLEVASLHSPSVVFARSHGHAQDSFPFVLYEIYVVI